MKKEFDWRRDDWRDIEIDNWVKWLHAVVVFYLVSGFQRHNQGGRHVKQENQEDRAGTAFCSKCYKGRNSQSHMVYHDHRGQEW